MENLPIKRAIISVTDKTGLIELAAFLIQNGVEIISTGGTEKALQAASFKVTPVQEITGFPEILNGRVKTLHPHVHAGILADKDSASHMDTLAALDIAAFDLVCVNLYDFARAASQKLPLKEAIEQIDIGGPCLLRAAAKNFHSVCVVPETGFYEPLIKELQDNHMAVTLAFRQKTAWRTFAITSRYDAMIASYLEP